MSGAAGAVALEAIEAVPLGVVDDLVLARVAVENGATRSELVRDMAPIASHRLSPSELRGTICLLYTSPSPRDRG